MGPFCEKRKAKKDGPSSHISQLPTLAPGYAREDYHKDRIVVKTLYLCMAYMTLPMMVVMNRL